jgi:hypothetical protein
VIRTQLQTKQSTSTIRHHWVRTSHAAGGKGEALEGIAVRCEEVVIILGYSADVLSGPVMRLDQLQASLDRVSLSLAVAPRKQGR